MLNSSIIKNVLRYHNRGSTSVFLLLQCFCKIPQLWRDSAGLNAGKFDNL
jgi:hypothetical protein